MSLQELLLVVADTKEADIRIGKYSTADIKLSCSVASINIVFEPINSANPVTSLTADGSALGSGVRQKIDPWKSAEFASSIDSGKFLISGCPPMKLFLFGRISWAKLIARDFDEHKSTTTEISDNPFDIP